ncbi:hypothetical protein PR048_008650 [Dryococelus australis]|uniref:Uncharacterized protein n=1 Tax=Dryococelus australis TaxID=614101 RepID=A0ABQ9HXP8_9NEOP|nr:hypothetical protein PR048_008650 [Dryococelus australis]
MYFADEFSSQGSEKDYQNSVMTFPVISECGETKGNGTDIGRCKVLYEYSANLYDELNLSPGMTLNLACGHSMAIYCTVY